MVPTLPPEARLHRLAGAYQLSRAVLVAARLGLGRHLAGGPRTAGELAAATGTRPAVLLRLLRLLAEIGVVEPLSGGRFGATELSAALDGLDHPGLGEEAWLAWGALPRALETGGSPLPEVLGASFFDHLDAHPERASAFAAANVETARGLAPVLGPALALEPGEVVVDIGGGDGTLLAALLRRAPGIHGVLLDRLAAVALAREVLARAGVGARCRVVAGDARRAVPAGGDLYLLCRVLFNLDDGAATAVLAACRRAMGGRGRLAVVELLLPEPGEPRPRGMAAADLHHFLLWGSGYRSYGEVAALLAAAGFGDAEVRSRVLAGGWSMISHYLSTGKT